MTISPEGRAALRTQHRLRPPGIKGALAQCGICWRRWPCPTIRLLDAVEAAEQQVAEMQRVMASCPNVHLVIRTDRRELFDGEYLDARGQVPMD